MSKVLSLVKDKQTMEQKAWEEQWEEDTEPMAELTSVEMVEVENGFKLIAEGMNKIADAVSLDISDIIAV